MTEDNVRSMFGGPPMVKEPNAETIDALEELLQMAMAGEIIGVAFVYHFFDGTAAWSHGGQIGSYSGLGAAHMLTRGIEEACE
jgi:hypothetical protein